MQSGQRCFQGHFFRLDTGCFSVLGGRTRNAPTAMCCLSFEPSPGLPISGSRNLVPLHVTLTDPRKLLVASCGNCIMYPDCLLYCMILSASATVCHCAIRNLSASTATTLRRTCASPSLPKSHFPIRQVHLLPQKPVISCDFGGSIFSDDPPWQKATQPRGKRHGLSSR